VGSEAAVGRRRGDPKIRREKDHVLKELDFNKQLNEQVMRNQADLSSRARRSPSEYSVRQSKPTI